MALPEATEVVTDHDRTFCVHDNAFATGQFSGDHVTAWFKATSQTRRRLLEIHGGRHFFTPRYVGRHGWLGAWLDEECDWSEVAALLRESYILTAPKSAAESLSTLATVRS